MSQATRPTVKGQIIIARPLDEVNTVTLPEPSTRRSGRKRKIQCFEVPSRSRPKKKKNAEEEFESSWICAECKEAECMLKPEADQLLICEGPCRRLFHYPCAGLQELPDADETYICSDCKEGRHVCSFCHEYGVDDVDVFYCSSERCGLFFHTACLSMQNVEMKTSAGDDGRESVVFTCPAHRCWTCVQDDLKKQEQEAQAGAKPDGTKQKRKKKKRAPSNFQPKSNGCLHRCLECPISYHVSCIPPTARFHELALLCHEHAEGSKLPYLNPSDSMQHQIERKVENYEAALTAKKILYRGKNPFLPLRGNKSTPAEVKLAARLESMKDISNDDNNGSDQPELAPFCLPCDIRDEVHSKPATFKHVVALQYNAKHRPPKRVLPGTDLCGCVGSCGEDCINRIMFTECFGDVNKDNTETNCAVGPTCGNRQVAQRRTTKCRPKREQGKGWGLVTSEKAPKGALLQEYVGEVIDTAEKERRLVSWAAEHPNDPNFYIMELCKGWFIDAREVANLSRFINHSCDPNCALIPINVNGLTRNAIVALRDIDADEFLSYDYRFDTRHGDKFVCRCGAAKCRGTMKGGVKLLGNDADDSKKTAAELWDEAKAKYDKDVRLVNEYYEHEDELRNMSGASVPGSDSPEELVANGPQRRNRKTAIQHGLFLWRNVEMGAHFPVRFASKKK